MEGYEELKNKIRGVTWKLHHLQQIHYGLKKRALQCLPRDSYKQYWIDYFRKGRNMYKVTEKGVLEFATKAVLAILSNPAYETYDSYGRQRLITQMIEDIEHALLMANVIILNEESKRNFAGETKRTEKQ